jgi:hypothetical protein
MEVISLIDDALLFLCNAGSPRFPWAFLFATLYVFPFWTTRGSKVSSYLARETLSKPWSVLIFFPSATSAFLLMWIMTVLFSVPLKSGHFISILLARGIHFFVLYPEIHYSDSALLIWPSVQPDTFLYTAHIGELEYNSSLDFCNLWRQPLALFSRSRRLWVARLEIRPHGKGNSEYHIIHHDQRWASGYDSEFVLKDPCFPMF